MRISIALDYFHSPKSNLSNVTSASLGRESVVSILLDIISTKIIIVPAFMDFFTNCEDGWVGSSILRSFELEIANELSLDKSIHPVFHLSKLSNITSSEFSSKRALLLRTRKPISIIIVPGCINNIFIWCPYWERSSFEVSLLCDFVFRKRILSLHVGKSKDWLTRCRSG